MRRGTLLLAAAVLVLPAWLLLQWLLQWLLLLLQWLLLLLQWLVRLVLLHLSLVASWQCCGLLLLLLLLLPWCCCMLHLVALHPAADLHGPGLFGAPSLCCARCVVCCQVHQICCWPCVPAAACLLLGRGACGCSGCGPL